MLNQELKRTSQAKTGLTGWAGLVRARLKLWHHMAPNPLSAHLFFGALCTALWCMCFWERVEITEYSVVHGLSGLR